MRNAIEIEDQKPRNSRDVIRDCRIYLGDVLAELDKPALERGEWKTPPDYLRSGGYWFRPASIAAPVAECDEHEQWRQKAMEALDSILHEVPEDHRHGLVGRVLSPSLKKLPDDAKLTERVLEMVGPPPESEHERAWRLHAACDQYFRWDLQQRVLAALASMPNAFVENSGACAMYVLRMQNEYAALQPARGKFRRLNVDDTDIALAIIRQVRACSIDKAAEEIAVLERLRKSEGCSSGRSLWDEMKLVDKMKRDGLFPSFAHLRKQGETNDLTTRAKQIARGYKDRARKAGWLAYGFKDPFEVLMAQPAGSASGRAVGSDTHVSPDELGAFALVVRSLASAGHAEREERKAWLHVHFKQHVLAALKVHSISHHQ